MCETLLTFCWISCKKNKFKTDTQWKNFYQNNFIVIFLCLHLLDERGQEVAALHKSDLLPQPHQPLSQAMDVYTILGTLFQTVYLR